MNKERERKKKSIFDHQIILVHFIVVTWIDLVEYKKREREKKRVNKFVSYLMREDEQKFALYLCIKLALFVIDGKKALQQ